MEEVGRVLVRRLFDEVFTTHNLAAADEIMAEEYVEHAIAPFGREEPGRVHGPSHTRGTSSSGSQRSSRTLR